MLKKKIKLYKIITYIISITFILSALLASVHYWCFNENFYTKEHNSVLLNNQHISEYIGVDDMQLKELTSFTLDYLNDSDASLDKEMIIKGELREVYTNDEKAHMVDVRRLNISSIYVLLISFIIFLASIIWYFYNNNGYKFLFNSYIKVLIVTIVLFGIIGIWIVIDFDSFWTLFHKIFFTGNDLWLLDLRTDILIMIVPPEFFNHLVIRIVITFIVVILLFGLFLYYLSNRKKVND